MSSLRMSIAALSRRILSMSPTYGRVLMQLVWINIKIFLIVAFVTPNVGNLIYAGF